MGLTRNPGGQKQWQHQEEAIRNERLLQNV